MQSTERKVAMGWPTSAVEFLELHARIEGALKQSGMVQEKKKRAEADWKALAESLGASFFRRIFESGKADTLIGEPPRRRMRVGMRWHPEQPAAIQDVGTLFLDGVCQVRNNLAHGEKFSVTGQGWDRDEELVTQAIWVLEQALQDSDVLRACFRY